MPLASLPDATLRFVLGGLQPMDLLHLARANRGYQQTQLKELTSLLCVPPALARRFGKAAHALRQELARPGWNEPRKEKLVREMAVGFERKEREFEHQGAINACWLALGGPGEPSAEHGAQARVRECPEPLQSAEEAVRTAEMGLLQLLSDSSARGRQAAIAGIACLGGRSCCRARVMDLLLHDASSDVRCTAADFLGQLLPTLRLEVAKPTIDALTKALQDRCPHVCARAASALRCVPQGETEPPVMELVAPTAMLLGSRDKFVRARARSVLQSYRTLADTRIVGFLMAKCDSAEGDEKLHAQRALANLGENFPRLPLESSLGSSFPASSGSLM